MPRLSTRIANIFRSKNVDGLGRENIRTHAFSSNPQADLAYLDAVYNHLDGIRPFGTELSKLQNMKAQLKAKLKPSDPGDDLSKTQIPGIVRRHGFFKAFTVAGSAGQGGVPLKRTRKEIEIHRNLEEHFRQIGEIRPEIENNTTAESHAGGARRIDPAGAATMLMECFKDSGLPETGADAVSMGGTSVMADAHAGTAILGGPAAALAPRAAPSASILTTAVPQKYSHAHSVFDAFSASKSAPDVFVWPPESFSSKAPVVFAAPIVAPVLFDSSPVAFPPPASVASAAPQVLAPAAFALPLQQSVPSAPSAPSASAAPAVAQAAFASPPAPNAPPVLPAPTVPPAPATSTSAAGPSIDTSRFATVAEEAVFDLDDPAADPVRAAGAATGVYERAMQFADEARTFFEAAVAAARAAQDQEEVAVEIATVAEQIHFANDLANGFTGIATTENQRAMEADQSAVAAATRRAELEQRVVRLQNDLEESRNAERAKLEIASEARTRATEASRQAAERRAQAAQSAVMYRQVQQRHAGTIRNLQDKLVSRSRIQRQLEQSAARTQVIEQSAFAIPNEFAEESPPPLAGSTASRSSGPTGFRGASATDPASGISELARQFADEARTFLEAAVAAERAAQNQEEVAGEVATVAENIQLADEMATSFTDIATTANQSAVEADHSAAAEAARRAELEQRLVALQNDLEESRNAESAQREIGGEARSRAAAACRQAAERREQAVETAVIYRHVQQRHSETIRDLQEKLLSRSRIQRQLEQRAARAQVIEQSAFAIPNVFAEESPHPQAGEDSSRSSSSASSYDASVHDITHDETSGDMGTASPQNMSHFSPAENLPTRPVTAPASEGPRPSAPASGSSQVPTSGNPYADRANRFTDAGPETDDDECDIGLFD